MIAASNFQVHLLEYVSLKVFTSCIIWNALISVFNFVVVDTAEGRSYKQKS